MEHYFSNPENTKELLTGIALLIFTLLGGSLLSIKSKNKKAEGNGTIIDQSGSTISNGDQVAGNKTTITSKVD